MVAELIDGVGVTDDPPQINAWKQYGGWNKRYKFTSPTLGNTTTVRMCVATRLCRIWGAEAVHMQRGNESTCNSFGHSPAVESASQAGAHVCQF